MEKETRFEKVGRYTLGLKEKGTQSQPYVMDSTLFGFTLSLSTETVWWRIYSRLVSMHLCKDCCRDSRLVARILEVCIERLWTLLCFCFGVIKNKQKTQVYSKERQTFFSRFVFNTSSDLPKKRRKKESKVLSKTESTHKGVN